MSATITVRIPKELKEELKKYRIEVSKVVRRAIEEEVRKKRIEKTKEAAKELGELFSRLPEEEIVKNIKEARRLR
ncbi:MAG: type II toxin-antitoxin system CcdA family antitoxin [Thermoproteota archaeon]|jgi:post-segregation antitoxin (ccd killing protein)